jgi:hypothetical protein
MPKVKMDRSAAPGGGGGLETCNYIKLVWFVVVMKLRPGNNKI